MANNTPQKISKTPLYATTAASNADNADDSPPTAAPSSAAFTKLQKRLATLPPSFRSECFTHLTAAKLQELESHLIDPKTNNEGSEKEAKIRAAVIGAALLRRIVHSTLQKQTHTKNDTTTTSKIKFEEALNSHELPASLLSKLSARYGDDNIEPPTWLGLLHLFEKQSHRSKNELWPLVDSAPWLDYVPVQCSKCGHVIPDETHPTLSDDDVGLKEVQPTKEEVETLSIRGGWYRGVRNPIIFQISCTKCNTISKWYRSADPKIMLTPEKWGRLCGEQEDLRHWFASNLDISLRKIIPLDWDHVWSEYKAHGEGGDEEEGEWMSPLDASARNFAVRLDEGIGSWSGIIAVGDAASSCECVTDAYLSTVEQNKGGRADVEFADRMERYRNLVHQAQIDPTGKTCQARTVNGYVLVQRAKFANKDITAILQRAASDFGTKQWWEVGEKDVSCVFGDDFNEATK